MLGRVHGIYTWMCPDCKFVNKSKLTPKCWWKIHCGYCQHKFIFGTTLIRSSSTGGTKQAPPTDTILYDSGVWASGQYVNSSYCDGCGVIFFQALRKHEASGLPMLQPRKYRHGKKKSA